jgi:hypothetical protein
VRAVHSEDFSDLPDFWPVKQAGCDCKDWFLSVHLHKKAKPVHTP